MGDEALVTAVLEDWRTAPVDERVRATLGFLEKVTLAPGEVDAADITPLHNAGVTDQAVQEALYVCFVFNIMDRLADAFDFHLPTAAGHDQHGRILHRLGYGISSIPG